MLSSVQNRVKKNYCATSGRRIFFRMSKLAAYLSITVLLSLSANVVESAKSIHHRRDELFELSVIHLNDFHSRFIEVGTDTHTCISNSEDECFGGIARLYTASHELMNERPNAIFLNAGDNFQGTLWYPVHGWNVTATFLNMLPQDVVTFGNHDFDDGIAGVVPFLKMLKAPVVVTNIDDTDEPDIQGLYSNSTIIVRNGTKIGVIGVVLTTFNVLSNTGNLKFFNEVETVNAEAEKLRNLGVGVIIVLSHCGIDVDRVIAAKCPNVDLIVGGHSHTFLHSGTSPHSDIPVDEYPVVVTQEQNNRTVLIVQAYAFTKYLGNISVWFDSVGEVIDWEGNPILLDNSVEQNSKVLALLEPWRGAVNELNNTIIGYTTVDLIDNCRSGECVIGNLITDSMIDVYVHSAENKTYWTYAAVACARALDIQTRSIAANSKITYGDAVTHQRTVNTWDVVELRGDHLTQVLENSVATSSSPDVLVNKDFLQWSGIQVTINLDNAPYSRVTSLKIRCRACNNEPAYEDVALAEWYRVVVPSSLVIEGIGNPLLIKYHRNRIVGPRNIPNYVNYIKDVSPITRGIQDRIVITGTWHAN